MIYQIHQSEILKWIKEYQGEPFHAILCDPPYHLTSIIKRFGKPDSAPAKGGVYNRAAKGFMGTTWDGGGIAFNPATWEALAEKLHPGGFGMAFSGSRGWHRMACAIEDAGLIIHPSIFGWAYLSGFPKATRIDTQIDKAAGLESIAGAPLVAPAGNKGRTVALGGSWQDDPREKIPATPQAQAWAGHRYGLQALKPALEPIIVFQRPYEGRPVDSIVATGAGSLWIDGGRIEAEAELSKNWQRNQSQSAKEGRNAMNGGLDTIDLRGYTPAGRWPANFVLSHSPLCNGACVPDCPVRLFDEQAGEQVSGGGDKGRVNHDPSTNIYQDGLKPIRGRIFEPDSGPASRMFHRSDFAYEIAEALANAEPVRYEPKASSGEREAGLGGFDEDDVQKYRSIRKNRGSGYDEASRSRNPHPTVKPISLTKYLSTLLLPPPAYAPRRILVPFSGVASECIGAILAGWDEVIGVEQSVDYVAIARARLAWWSQWPGWGQTDVDAILEAANKEQEQSNNQLPLFKAA